LKAFSDAFVQRLNALDSPGVFFKAAQLTVAGSTHHFADVTDPVMIDGQVYTCMPMSWQGVSQRSDMALMAVQVTVPNLTGEVSAFVEGNELLGGAVTLMLCHLDLLGVANARETLRLQVLAVSWRQWTDVSFTCGLDLSLAEQIPGEVITRVNAPGTPDLMRRASIL